jgi:polyhydroxybutyrate depolymerase
MKNILLLLTLMSIHPLLASTSKENISIDKMQRTYYLHLPSNYEKKKSLPLIFFLHGGGQNIKRMARHSLLNTLSDKYGFIVVYPLGVDKHWKDGRGVTYGGKSKKEVNDVKFVSQLIDTLVKTHKVDKTKVYASGLSNGGMMTLRLGCDISHKLAAIAPVIANIPKNIIGSCKPKSPLSVLLMNGTVDPILPWDGGEVKFFRKRMGEVVSTNKTINLWVKHNQCKKIPKTKELKNISYVDKSRVKVSTYEQCKNHTSVKLYAIIGGGHTLPSRKGKMRRITGPTNKDIEGIKVIVDFLLKH